MALVSVQAMVMEGIKERKEEKARQSQQGDREGEAATEVKTELTLLKKVGVGWKELKKLTSLAKEKELGLTER